MFMLFKTPEEIFYSKVLKHTVQLPQKLFCNIAVLWGSVVVLAYLLSKMIYDFLDHKGHIMDFFFSLYILLLEKEQRVVTASELQKAWICRQVDLKKLSLLGVVIMYVIHND